LLRVLTQESHPALTQAVLATVDGEQDRATLAVAFEQFTDLSAQLTQSYLQLEHRVSELTTELGIAADQRVRALEEKEKLANRLENLLKVLPAGVVVLNASGSITDCNPAAEELLAHPQLGEAWRDVIKRCFAPQQDDGHEISTWDGRKIHLATRSLDEQGQIILLTDNTETRRLQAELSRQDRLNSLGKMVSALAHQIRTPLSAAMLYAGHLCDEKLSSEKHRQFSYKLVSRLHYLEHQVRDMLLFAKGEVSLNDRVNLAQVQQSLLEAVEATLFEKNVVCECINRDPELIIRCNLNALIGALTNLVNNAIQAMTIPPLGDVAHAARNTQPTLEIELSPWDNSSVVIAINDNGPGIDPQQLKAVQEAFVTTKAQGIGLGLAVVNVVAHAHGGKFDLQLRSKGGVSAQMILPKE
jgi:two-component system, sensor histidine kinase FlrB